LANLLPPCYFENYTDDCCELGCNECYGKIADHLLANGVLVPPCNIGDTVHCIYAGKIQEMSVSNTTIESKDNHFDFIFKCATLDGYVPFHKFVYGKDVFIEKEEAEQALAERQTP
jgi:hypothetical protein